MAQTTWEKIYIKYKKTGKKWASLRDPVHPSFLSFIRHAKFDLKSALDLGCGNGTYLKFLQDAGFGIAGIDSSQTGIRLARKTLGKKADIRVGNIYTKSIAARKYDLILSVATIQHAKKSVIKKLIARIFIALPSNGKVFVTFPRMNSLRQWRTFGKSKMIAPGTYAPLRGPEKGLPHSFYEKSELEKLFSRFRKVKIARDDMGRWIVRGEK
jgi:SAM-dependent methyltransferase